MISRTHLNMANKLVDEWGEQEPMVLLTAATLIFRTYTKQMGKDLVELFRDIRKDINLMELGYEPE